MPEEKEDWSAHNIGGTIVAIFLSIIVYLATSIIVSIIASSINYYMSSMGIDAATFLGGILGSIFGVYSARASCDSILKSYSQKPIFVIFALLMCAAIFYEFVAGISWEALPRLAQCTVTLFVSWVIFWQGTDI